MSLNNGWTGGQYSLFRIIFGTYLTVHFASLAPWAAEMFSNAGVLPEASASPLLYFFPNTLALWDGPWFVTGLVIAATVLGVLFIIGFHDRAAAVGLWYIWACLHGRMPFISNPGLPYVGWMLLAHACLPPAPYGSWSARGRVDPGGGWRFPPPIFFVAWLLMALGYTYSGYTKLISPSWVDGTAMARVLENPLARPGPIRDAVLALPDWLLRLGTWSALAAELAFAPLALFRRLRPVVWAMMLLMHLGLMMLIDFADLSLGMVMLHLFTFDPGWIVGQRVADGTLVEDSGRATEIIFYDGHCGLCHGFVRFVLAEDRDGESLRFAPLQGERFQSSVPGNQRAALPDSIVVRDCDGRLLTRSDAVLHVARRLGGVWRLLASAGRLLPRPLRNAAYDGVARVRHRLFGRPTQACPLLPKQLRSRFLG